MMQAFYILFLVANVQQIWASVSVSNLKLYNSTGYETDSVNVQPGREFGQYLMFDYHLNESDTLQAIQFAVGFDVIMNWTASSGNVTFGSPLNEENARFEVCAQEQLARLTFIAPEIKMAGLYLLTVQSETSSATDAINVITWSTCPEYKSELDPSLENCQVWFKNGCFGPNQQLYPEPRSHESYLFSDTYGLVQSFPFTKGPVNIDNDLFSYFVEGNVSIDDSLPKDSVIFYHLDHAPSQDLGGIVITSETNLNAFAFEGCSDWRPFCESGDTQAIPPLYNGLNLTNMVCSVSNAKDSLDNCRSEILPDNLTMPATVTFACTEARNCTMKWPEGSQLVEQSKVWTCDVGDYHWQEMETDENLWPYCVCGSTKLCHIWQTMMWIMIGVLVLIK